MRILTCFCFYLLCSTASSQEVQNKVFIIDENYYVPLTNNKIGLFCHESIDSVFMEATDCRELPIGLLSISNNAVKYAIRDGKVISASFLDSRNHYWGGPAITATKPDKMRNLNDREVKEFLEDYGATYHSVFDETILNGKPLREAVFKNNFEELIFDFAVTEEGRIFCFIILTIGVGRAEPVLEIWKLLDGSKDLINWFEQPKDTDWAKLKTDPELISSFSIPEKMEEMTSFSLNNQLFVFNPISGNFYQLTESGFQKIHVGLTNENLYLNSTLIVDEDNNKVFLLSKAVLKQEKKSFREIVERYGIEIPILK